MCFERTRWHWHAEVRRYGRSTSAGGTTTVATPAPHSAASALAGSTKGQVPTAPVQASALSASLAGTAQPSSPLKDPSGSSRPAPQLQAQQVSSTLVGTPKLCRHFESALAIQCALICAEDLSCLYLLFGRHPPKPVRSSGPRWKPPSRNRVLYSLSSLSSVA